MKLPRILLSALALGAIATITNVQAAPKRAPAAEGRKGGANAEQMVARLDHAIGGLTAEQKTKITAIIQENMQKAKEAAPEDRRAIMQAQRTQIREVLNAEQQKKYDSMPQRGPGRKKKSE